MSNEEELKKRIEQGIDGAQAEVIDYTGGGDHFRAIIASPAFAGLSRIEQHRMVYACVQDLIDDGTIHALTMQTTATEQ